MALDAELIDVVLGEKSLDSLWSTHANAVTHRINPSHEPATFVGFDPERAPQVERAMFVMAIVLSVLCAACGSTTATSTNTEQASQSESQPEHQNERTSEPDDGQAEAEVIAPEAPVIQTVTYADLRSDRSGAMVPPEGIFFDFGTSSAAGLTLASWGTGVEEVSVEAEEQQESEPVQQGGESGEQAPSHVAVMRSNVARLQLSVPQGTSVSQLNLRLAATTATPASLYIDGEAIDHKDIGRDFQTWNIELEEALAPGDHQILIRARRRGNSDVYGSGTLILDSLYASNSQALPRDDWHYRVPVLVPESGELVATSSRPFEIAINADGIEPVEQAAQNDSGEFVVRVPLDPFETRIAWVEARPTDGSLELQSLTLEVPAPTEAAQLFSPPKHVLLILIDTLRTDRLTPYNAETRVQTPRLADYVSGLNVLENAHTQENWTKPSVATLMTSLMPWEHRATEYGSRVRDSEELLPERLQDAGFFTGSFICNGFVSDAFGFQQGWDTYRNYIREGRRTRSEFVAADVLSWFDHWQERNDTRAAEGDEEQPFFLYVHTIDPHVPYRPPNSFLNMYGDSGYRGRVNFSRDATLLENIKAGNLRLDQRDRDHLEALYDAEISYHDQHFGSILDGLERRGLAEETMVIITSDHGEEFWDHGSVGHGHSVYEELLHIPMFVRIPGLDGRSVEAPVGLVDVLPTIFEVLDLPIPDGLSGRSFLPDLLGVTRPRGTISGFMDNWRTFNVGRWKLIERPRGRHRTFDLELDPREEDGIANEQAMLTRAALRMWMGQRMIDTYRQSARSPRRRQQQNTTVDAETEAQLRALGYIR